MSEKGEIMSTSMHRHADDKQKRSITETPIYAAILLALVVALVMGLSSVALAAVAVDATTYANAIDVNTISVPHTTGAGANRLMLVGVGWNCGTTTSENETISSATFTPSGGVRNPSLWSRCRQSGTDYRYAALYRLLSPPTGAGR